MPFLSLGGGYLTCDSLSDELRRNCLPIGYRNVTVKRNTALITAGGLFVNAVSDLETFSVGNETSKSGRGSKSEGVVHVYLKNNQILVSLHAVLKRLRSS